MGPSGDDRIMRAMALRYIVACLPEEAARALAALADTCPAAGDKDAMLGSLSKEGMFNAGRAGEMPAGDAIALAAFRYHLGRSTASVHTCIEWLAAQWDGLGESVRDTIAVEIRAALTNGRAGHPVDARAWNDFVDRTAMPAPAP